MPVLRRPPPRLRRFLPADFPFRSTAPNNPFEAARRHSAVRPLVIGIHSGGLNLSASPEQRLIRAELSLPRPQILEVLRTDGPLPVGIDPAVPTITIENDPDSR